MTTTLNESTLESELLNAIDAFIAELGQTTIVDTAKVVNFALDMRLIVGRHSAN